MKIRIISYWVSTLFIAGFMAFNAMLYLTESPKMVAALSSLGYPVYFLKILGVAKLLGAVALLAPGLGRLKEWAYAGFTFTFIGAVWSHLASGQPQAVLMPIACLIVLFISYALRPPARRLPRVVAVNLPPSGQEVR